MPVKLVLVVPVYVIISHSIHIAQLVGYQSVLDTVTLVAPTVAVAERVVGITDVKNAVLSAKFILFLTSDCPLTISVTVPPKILVCALLINMSMRA